MFIKTHMTIFYDIFKRRMILLFEHVNSAEVENEEYDTQENFLEDLLEDIDRQEASDLGVDKVEESGITSREQAEYFIRRLKKLKKQQEDVEAVAKQRTADYKRKVDNWKNSRLSTINASIEFVEAHLTAYLEEELAGTEKKSISTVEGTIGIKKVAPHYDYDDKKVLKFLNENPDRDKFIKRTEEIRKNELKKYGKIGENGAFYLGEDSVPGVLVTYMPDKLFVR